MEMIFSGLVLWILVHLIPSATPNIKTDLVNKFGENTYKLLFSILIFSALFLMIYGWRHSVTTQIYQLPDYIYPISTLLMLCSYIIYGSAILPTRLLNTIRHPQLLSVFIWSFAHLLSNGDSRSILLFSGMGIWAMLEIIFINKREGEWEKPAKPAVLTEIKSLAVSLVLFVAILYGHGYLSGVALV
ncbi:MAG: NnrU family protein [Gammaproteobacteria bacterium]|nr:NnrU family protein [Gammaproteobacteria bacterium]